MAHCWWPRTGPGYFFAGGLEHARGHCVLALCAPVPVPDVCAPGRDAFARGPLVARYGVGMGLVRNIGQVRDLTWHGDATRGSRRRVCMCDGVLPATADSLIRCAAGQTLRGLVCCVC